MNETDHNPSPPPSPSAGPVVIIGGGPAGCSAAAALGRLGFRPILLESGEPGRDKACGDAFEPEALAILEAIGVGPADWEAAGGVPVSGAVFRCTVPGGPEQRLDTPIGWQIPRAALDQRLRDTIAPHADIRYGTRAVSVRNAADRWEVVVKGPSGARSVIGASAVILAHGTGSPLSRQWNIDGDPDRAAAVRTYVAAPGLGASLVEIAPETMPGYAWAFPLARGRANVGFGMFARGRANLREHAGAFLERHGWTAEAPWLGSGLAIWSGRGEVWHHPQGMVSCGDAAGLVEPLTGGGIAHALRSGRAAGNTIARFLRSGRNPGALGFHSVMTGAYYGRRFAVEGALKFWTGFLDRVARVTAHMKTSTGEPAGTRTARIHRGDVFWIGPDDSRGPVPSYSHPHVVVQDDVFNHSRITTVVVCALTSNLHRANEPGNVLLEAGEGNLPRQSVVVVSQVSSVDKARLGERIGSLSDTRVEQILAGLRFQQASFFGR